MATESKKLYVVGRGQTKEEKETGDQLTPGFRCAHRPSGCGETIDAVKGALESRTTRHCSDIPPGGTGKLRVKYGLGKGSNVAIKLKENGYQKTPGVGCIHNGAFMATGGSGKSPMENPIEIGSDAALVTKNQGCTRSLP